MSERDSFEAFVASASPSLMRFATSLAGSSADGADLTQECLVRLAARWNRLDRTGDVLAYARTAIVRLNLNRVRRIRREAAALRRHGAITVREDSPWGWEPWLEAAVAALTERQRSAVILRHVWEYPIEEIAAAMGCRPTSVKTHLARGLQSLRAAAPQHQPDPIYTERD